MNRTAGHASVRRSGRRENMENRGDDFVSALWLIQSCLITLDSCLLSSNRVFVKTYKLASLYAQKRQSKIKEDCMYLYHRTEHSMQVGSDNWKGFHSSMRHLNTF
jgi:hypothetical protein